LWFVISLTKYLKNKPGSHQRAAGHFQKKIKGGMPDESDESLYA
jgi:hypothetical protein